MDTIIKVCEVEKFYGNKDTITKAVNRISFEVEKGEFTAIMGASGSGKTTLLNLLATVDQVTSGHIFYDNMDITTLKEEEVAKFRKENLGFVFQDFNLLDTFSVRDNILLPLVLSKVPYLEMECRLAPLADKLGLTELLDKFPYEISGGQKQRTAAARALITNPHILLADEPTGALDSRAADGLLRMFGQINREGQTILMVTHSVRAASHAGRILFIKDGEVFHQLYRGRKTNDELYQNIADTLTMITTGGDRR